MGWKIFKDHFNIDKHHVVLDEEHLCIGSSYSSALVSIDMKTGNIIRSEVSPNFLEKMYPNILLATKDELVELIEAQDIFTASIPVYTWENGEVIEKFCEEPDWPNVTHDGLLMYENTFSVDKQSIAERAKINENCAIEFIKGNIAESEKELKRLKEQLVVHEGYLDKLEADYPTLKK